MYILYDTEPKKVPSEIISRGGVFLCYDTLLFLVYRLLERLLVYYYLDTAVMRLQQ